MKHDEQQISAIGYGRTSSENLGAVDSAKEKVSCSIQSAEFDAACKDNGWDNAGWFEDRDLSGRCYSAGASIAEFDTVTTDYVSSKSKTKQTRQGLVNAFKHAKDVGASVLWCRDETRFYRPLSGSMLSAFLRGELARVGLTLWSGETGKIDFKNLSTNIVQNLQNEIKSQAILDQTRRSVSSKNNMRDKGLATSSTFCFGYCNIGKQQVAVVEDQAKIVERIFSDYTKGKSVNSICKTLTRENVPTFSTGTVWNRQALRRILLRPFYCGLTRRTDGELIPSLVYSAIITREAWNKAQARLGYSKETAHSRESKYAHSLAGKVRCGVCGHIMRPFHSIQTVKGKKYAANYYACGYCDTEGKSRNMIREAIAPLPLVGQEKGYLGQSASKPRYASVGLVEALYPFTLAGYIRQLLAKDATPELLQKREVLKSEAKALDSKIAQRYKDFEEGLLPRLAFVQLSQEAKDRQSIIQSDLARLEKQITASSSKLRLTVADIDSLQAMSYQTYTALLNEVVSEIVIHSDRVDVVMTDRDTHLSINRVRIGNARGLPVPQITYTVPGDTYRFDKQSGSAILKQKTASDNLMDTVFVSYPVPNSVPQTLYSTPTLTVSIVRA